MRAAVPNARPVPFPDQRLPRHSPRDRNAAVWIRVAGSWRAGHVITWVRVGPEWHCWTRHEDPDTPIHGHSAWYAYDPRSIVRRE